MFSLKHWIYRNTLRGFKQNTPTPLWHNGISGMEINLYENCFLWYQKHLNQMMKQRRTAVPCLANVELSGAQLNNSHSVLQWAPRPLLKKSNQQNQCEQSCEVGIVGLCPFSCFPFRCILNVSPCHWTSSAFAHVLCRRSRCMMFPGHGMW